MYACLCLSVCVCNVCLHLSVSVGINVLTYCWCASVSGLPAELVSGPQMGVASLFLIHLPTQFSDEDLLPFIMQSALLNHSSSAPWHKAIHPRSLRLSSPGDYR